MAALIENIAGGTYNGSGAVPNNSVAPPGIVTNGPDRLIVIVCVTSRENTSADINQVTAISASGLTFTRIFHDVSWTYSDSVGSASFPVASHSIDIFTAPAASTIGSALAWAGTVSGDGFVNHGSCWQFAVSGLADINNPFDSNVTTPVTQKNATGVSSALQIAGLTTANANDLILAILQNHNPATDATPSVGAGWTLASGAISNGGGSSGHHSIIQYKNFISTQSSLTVPTNYSDKYWYGVALAFAGVAAGTTSYSNWGGRGRRTGLIASSYTGITGSGCQGTHPDLMGILDGVKTTGCQNAFAWDFGLTNVALKFDFRAGNKMIIDEFTWFQDVAATHGTWNFAGSNDDISYTDLKTGFTLGNAVSATSVYSFTNSTGYRFYKLYQVSGGTSNTPWIEEIEFKIVQDVGQATYDAPISKGNRTGIITATFSGITGGCGSNYAVPLIDGSQASGSCTTSTAWGGANTAAVLKFDLGAGNGQIITEFLWHQDQNATHGTWSFAGSNDDITYTNLRTGITLGVNDPVNNYGQAPFPITNATKYRYYKLFQTAGVTSPTPWLEEIEFKVNNSTNLLAVTEPPDTMAASGFPGVFGKVGDLHATENTDTFDAIGFGPVVGTWRSTEAIDTFSAFISQPIHATMSATEAHDRFSAAGLGRGEDGVFITTENADVFAATGFTPNVGIWASTENSDQFRAVSTGVTSAKKRRIFFVT